MPWGLPRKLFAVFTHIMLRAMVRHNRDRASAWSGEPGGAHVIMAWYMVCAAAFIAVHLGTRCSIDLGQPGNHTGVGSISPAQDCEVECGIQSTMRSDVCAQLSPCSAPPQ